MTKIVSLSLMGSSEIEREAEFQSEITSYWSRQHDWSLQNLILLNRPRSASTLLALSDPRQAIPSGRETVWLATNTLALKKHYERMIGKTVPVRAAETPGFYVKLQSYPSIRVPDPKHVMSWLTPHLKPDDARQLLSWFDERGSPVSRWIVLELPGDRDAPIYCLNVRSRGMQPDRSPKFGLRSARRRPPHATAQPPASIQASTLDVLDRATIMSRDPSGTNNDLENTRVVCVGTGSLGGTVALQLARSGVGHITLIDPDTLASANLGRHVLGVDDLGRPKASALRDKIHRDLPTTEVAAHVGFVEDVMHKNPEMFEKANLIVITTADWQSESLLWKAKSDGAPWRLLQAWSEPHAQVGHALLAPNGAFDARYLFGDNGDFRHKFTEWPGGGLVALPACGESFIPGGSLGMTNIACMVSQTALRALTGHVEHTAWISSIYRPQDIVALGGRYYGPELSDGVQQIVLERGWPEHEARTEQHDGDRLVLEMADDGFRTPRFMDDRRRPE
ncbi:MAG: ThiF family adenylyltransferase [Betaproteobacteria bacterium]|nr:ThiF family adenylyltransferase [Betaproteobacteria bacterium]